MCVERNDWLRCSSAYNTASQRCFVFDVRSYSEKVLQCLNQNVCSHCCVHVCVTVCVCREFDC